MYLKVQCVQFRGTNGIYYYIITFSLVFNHLKERII